MSKGAWVTLATNDSYSLGALVLAHSLQRVGSAYPAVVMITPSVTQLMRERLSTIFAEVIMVDVLDSEDAAHLALLARPELGITFTKLHCWRLTQYEKAVFLDADTLVLQNCDELFEREELSAAPDVGWPDCFNSGVFVYRPSSDTFQSLLKFARDKGSFDGGDQGLLNMYFSSWATADITKHLPFLYNVCSAAFYSYLPALKQYGQNMKIMHFIGNAKPWLQNFNWETRSVQDGGVGGAGGHLQPTLQLWWDIFCSNVHPHLDSTMAMFDTEHTLHERRAPEPSRYQPAPDPLSLFPWHRPEDEAEQTQEREHDRALALFYDPWDHYQGETASSPQNHTQHINQSFDILKYDTKPSEHTVHNVNYHDIDHSRNQDFHNDHKDVHDHRDSCKNYDNHNRVHDHTYDHYDNHHHEQAPMHHDHNHQYEEPLHIHIPEQILHQDWLSECDGHSETSDSTHYESPPVSRASCSPIAQVEVPKPRHPYDNFYMIHRPVIDKSGCKRCSHEVVVSPPPQSPPLQSLSPGNEEDAQAGLAGTFSQLSLGAGTPAQHDALDQHTRRQGWEAGNIDYMGADAFDNIWARISHTLTSPPPETPSDASSASDKQTASDPIQETKADTIVAGSAPVEPKPVVEIPKPLSPSTPVQVDVAKVATKTTDAPKTPVAVTSGKEESVSTPKPVYAVVSPSTPLAEPVSEADTKTADEQIDPTGSKVAPSPSRKPKGKLMCHLRPAPESVPLLTPDSEFEDAATLAQSIIAGELTPTITSPTPPALCSPPLRQQLTKDLSVDNSVPETPPAKGPVSLAQIGIVSNNTDKVKAPLDIVEEVKEVPPSTVTAQAAPISLPVHFTQENQQSPSGKTLGDTTESEEKPVQAISVDIKTVEQSSTSSSRIAVAPSDKMFIDLKAETQVPKREKFEKIHECVEKKETVVPGSVGSSLNTPLNIPSSRGDTNAKTAPTKQISAPRRPKAKKLPKEPKEELVGTQTSPTSAGVAVPPVPPPRKKEKKPKENY